MPLATFLQKSPVVIAALIATLLAYQLALLTWSLVPEEKSVLIWKPVAANSNQDSQKIDTQKLQQQHLFGEISKKTEEVAQQTSVVDAPKTRLNLKLVGVVAASDPQYSSAIIDQRGSQGSFFVDSKVDGTNATITQIHQDRIILDVGGVYQTLMLEGVEILDKQVQNHEQQSQTEHTGRAKKAFNKEAKTVNLDRKELLENPGKLTDYIRISPVREDGQIKGYRVNPGKDPSIFEEAGLKSGDLAVELNGIDLTDMSEAMTLMQEFPTMTDMTLSIERDGQLHELYFSIP